jgi:hypothetical protein
MFGLKHIAVVLFVTAAIILAGCLGLGQTQQSSMETVSKGSGGLSYTGVVPAPASAPAVRIAGDQSTGTTNADQGVDTKIIKTGQVTIEVPQVPAAIDRVRDIAVSNGGYLSSSSIDTSQNDRKTGYAAIRIPAEKFDSVMQALAPLGKVISSSEQRSDVTEQYVDLTIQNKSYHTQLENYYRLMAKADKVEDIIKIQAQIDQITMSLNQIEGRLRYLNSQIDLSTINVNLQEPEPVGGETGHSFVTAINAGIGGFFAFIDTVIFLFLTFLIPILAAIIIYVAYWWQKKQKGAAAPPAEVKKEG